MKAFLNLTYSLLFYQLNNKCIDSIFYSNMLHASQPIIAAQNGQINSYVPNNVNGENNLPKNYPTLQLHLRIEMRCRSLKVRRTDDTVTV